VLHRRRRHTGRVNRKDTGLAALVAALWGFNFVVIDWGMGTVPPLLFAAIRFTVVVLPACFFVKRPPVPFKTVAAVGAFMSLGQFGFLYLSMHVGMPPGLASLVLSGQSVFTIVIASVALRERPSRAQVAGVVLGLLGLAMVAFGIGGRVPLIALALCLLAALSWGVGNVVSRASRAPGGLALTVWSATVAPVPLLALSLLVDGPHAVGQGLAHLGWHGIASTVYTAGLCSLVGYAIWNRLLSRYPSGHVVPWVLLAPVVAMGSSWALLGEAPGPAELAGAVLLIGGVLISQSRSRAATQPVARGRRVGGRRELPDRELAQLRAQHLGAHHARPAAVQQGPGEPAEVEDPVAG
jgi:O-acetylserine/cysteine efflux transporter